MYSYFSYKKPAYSKCYYDVIEKNKTRNFLAKSRVLIFQIKLRTQNYCNYSFLSLYLNNFASQKLRYDKIGPQTTLD